MARVVKLAQQIADSEASVLITGESGTGKELVARSIHNQSSRKDAPICVNCAAIPATLLERNSSATRRARLPAQSRQERPLRGGRRRHRLLDEMGELPLELQPKLLRALQERVIEPVGGTKELKLDVRVLAATNLDMDTALANGAFREDLYYPVVGHYRSICRRCANGRPT